jgi:hypothetical protein
MPTLAIALALFGGWFMGGAVITRGQDQIVNGFIGSWLCTLATILVIAEKVIQ